jgi:hypothetical protein
MFYREISGNPCTSFVCFKEKRQNNLEEYLQKLSLSKLLWLHNNFIGQKFVMEIANSFSSKKFFFSVWLI